MSQSVPASLIERMVSLRREFHRHPELSWAERWTADRVAAELEACGLHPRRVLATGLVADIPGPSGTPAVALRADMDALPIREETGLPFASEVEGVMHACGHDAHTAMLLGAASLLLGSDPLPAPVRLIFQPAEEVGSGARAMVDAGVLERVGAIFGGHVDGRFPSGTIVAARGTVGASSDSFRIAIRGREGHAARPHETVDAVVVGSLIVMALQTIVAREIDPAHPSVVTVGSFNAGSAANVIAGSALLEGTIRAHDAGVREHLMRSVRRICESTAQLHQARIEIEIADGTPMLVNRGPMTGVAQQAAEAVVGPKRVRRAVRAANMGGEDFAWYLQHVPGCYVRFGIRRPGAVAVPTHSSRFDIDEEVLATGAAWLAEVARRAGRAMASGPGDGGVA